MQSGRIALCAIIIPRVQRGKRRLRRHFPRRDGTITRLEEKAHLKSKQVTKYKYWGLMIFVAIPLPGTGAWTGSLIAAVLDMSIAKSFPTIVAGVVIAGVLIMCLTGMVTLMV